MFNSGCITADMMINGSQNKGCYNTLKQKMYVLILMLHYRIVVRTRRCGGAFGCKIARQMFTTCATALAAFKLNRPCRMAMRMPDIMRITGKRPDSRLDYEVRYD